MKLLKTTFFISTAVISMCAQASDFDESVFSNLDYGLYWADEDNGFIKAGTDTVDGYGSYYDVTKPTIIYIHGWQEDSVEELSRETFYNTNTGRPDVDFAQMWQSYGYNIGIMYWNQFADEDEVKDAESKIWSTEGDKGMRWLDSDGEYHYDDVDQPVAELFLENYIEAMSGYEGDDIRIAGHSLGNQVAIRLTSLLQESAQSGDIEENLVPGRVSLLDAFYSNWSKSYLDGQWVGEAALELVEEMIDYGTAIDSYRTSSLSSTFLAGDENQDLHNQTAFCEQDTSFFDLTEQAEKHVAAIWLYLWSIDYSEPTVEDSTSLGVSAAADNDLVLEWMAADKHIDQSQGGDTKDPGDNTYELTDRL